MMGQTVQGAQRPTNSIITPKDTLVMGNWNVRSLYRGGATAQVAREIERYKLDILGISKCRWTGAGRQRIANKRESEKEEMVLDWTCPEERSEQ